MKKRSILACLFLLAFNSFATAQNNVVALSGAYLGFNAGSMGIDVRHLSNDTKQQMTSYEQHFGASGCRLYGGYLWDNDKFSNLKYGVELGGLIYENNTYKLNEQKWVYSGYASDLLGVVQYNILGSKFNVFGKLGVAFINQKVETSGYNNLSNSSSTTKLSPEISFGFGYNFTPHLGMNITFANAISSQSNEVSYGTTSLNKIDGVNPIQSLTLGITYYFG